MISKSLINELIKALGKEFVSTSKEDITAYSYDATNLRYEPDCVVFPANAFEVSEVLKLANAELLPVVARGAGTGFTGGSLAVNGGVVLSMERMDKIIEIDAANMTAVVEPGVITGDFQDEVEKTGLFYPPDPTSLKFSTIGGNIAECAGGPRALKYGVTRDYVLGMEIVLATGEIIMTGTKKTVKGVVGYDLTRLIVGSEGTLGVVTKAFLRLIPLPVFKKTMLLRFDSLEDALSTVERIIKERIVPSTIEFIDGASLKCLGEHAVKFYAEAVLLIEVDGIEEAVEKESSEIRRISIENKAISYDVASDKNEVKDLWEIRRGISPALNKIKPNKLNEDIVVPRTNLVELIKGIRAIAKNRDVAIASFGHAGDGNIHVNVMVDKKDAGEFKRGESAVRDIFELTLKLGGTISGEHGIGITKAPYIGMELGADTIGLMRRIKETFDPNGILNPGKIFPAPVFTAGFTAGG